MEFRRVLFRSNATRAARGQRLPPSRFFRGQFQHATMPRRVGQQLATELKWIFASGFGKFLYKTLRDESVVRISHRPPEAHANAGSRQRILDQTFWNRIFAVTLPFDGSFIDAV